jgi:cytochrome c553/uncharacterized protein GlcG (DUF336 family)
MEHVWRKRNGLIILAMVTAPFPSGTAAQEMKPFLTLKTAKAMADAADKKASDMGIKVHIAIVDDGGNLKYYLRQDGAPLVAEKISQMKAFTAVAMEKSTAEVGEISKAETPGIELVPNLIKFGGGIPIRNSKGADSRRDRRQWRVEGRRCRLRTSRTGRRQGHAPVTMPRSHTVSRRAAIAVTLILSACLLRFQEAAAQQRQMPPAWPYAQTQLPPGEMPPQAPAPKTPPVASPNLAPSGAPEQPLLQAKGSRLRFTQQQIGNSYGPADWFPDSHPRMPDIVAHGKPGVARACGLCHLPDGRGRPENAPLQSLPEAYIVEQLRDFQQGLRHSADPRKANTLEMENIAKTLTDDEIKEAATYFAGIKVPQYVRVVETEKVPATQVQGEIYFVTDGPEEPIGVRIIETPEDAVETRLRNPKSGFIAYAPIGSIKRGEVLATTGANGKTTACGVCHGPELKGLGPVPNLAGRSPSYLARQMYDMKLGTRTGGMVPLMMPILANLTDADIVDLVAYMSSRAP